MNPVGQYLNDFMSLIFPRMCYACGKPLVSQEQITCISCEYQLPYTDFHLDKDNKLARQFWGRIRLESAGAYLYFRKSGKVQNLMHQLKYHNHPEIGTELGKRYGNILKKQDIYQQVEAIVPVPIHRKKRFERGYNQSQKIAEGLSLSLGIPADNDLLERVHQKESQTRTERKMRFENIETAFKTTKQHQLKEVLLVDDTITTGSTLEACANVLINSGVEKVHIAGLAFVS